MTQRSLHCTPSRTRQVSRFRDPRLAGKSPVDVGRDLRNQEGLRRNNGLKAAGTQWDRMRYREREGASDIFIELESVKPVGLEPLRRTIVGNRPRNSLVRRRPASAEFVSLSRALQPAVAGTKNEYGRLHKVTSPMEEEQKSNGLGRDVEIIQANVLQRRNRPRRWSRVWKKDGISGRLTLIERKGTP